MGFLIVVNILVFVLGCFIDFFEIAFIVVPILAPVAAKILPELMPGVPVDQVMIWFGVILAMNLQTSFLTPPFGFALFYLRSVAAKQDYKDRITGQTIPAVTTAQIYKGSIAFIVLQLAMVAAVVLYPALVTGGIAQGPAIDAEKALEQMALPEAEPAASDPGADLQAPQEAASEAAGGSAPAAEDDPAKALEDALKSESGTRK
jgi:hypothetical protein